MPSRKVIGPSRSFLFDAFFVVFVVSAFLLIRLDSDQTILGVILGVMFFFGSAVYLFALLRRAPRLILRPEGLVHVGFVRDKFRPWTEIGPFTLEKYIVPSRGQIFLKHMFGARALSDFDHDLLVANGRDATSPELKQELRISFLFLLKQNNQQAAEELVNELNKWRDEFGAPEMDPNAATAKDELRTIDRRLQSRNMWLVVITGIFAIALPALALLNIYFDLTGKSG